MLDVGWPDPALVEERIESTRSWAARSATVSRPIVEAECVVVMSELPSGCVRSALLPSEHAPRRAAQAGSPGTAAQAAGPANRNKSPSALNLNARPGYRTRRDACDGRNTRCR